jgi:hypothetical protein
VLGIPFTLMHVCQMLARWQGLSFLDRHPVLTSPQVCLKHRSSLFAPLRRGLVAELAIWDRKV